MSKSMFDDIDTSQAAGMDAADAKTLRLSSQGFTEAQVASLSATRRPSSPMPSSPRWGTRPSPPRTSLASRRPAWT